MRVYTVPLVALAVTTDADQDIFEIVMGAGVVGHLLSYMLESALTTDERLNWRLLRRTTTGSGGTGCTEVPVDAGDAAATAAVSQLVTTPGTAGAVLDAGCWSTLTPRHMLEIPESRIKIPPGGRLGFNLQTAVGATRSFSGFVKWAEEG